MSPIGHVKQLVLRIERDSVHVRESSAFALQTPQRLLVSGCSLTVNRHFRRILHADKKLLLFFIDSQGEAAMRSRQDTRRFEISIGFAREHDDLVAGVGLDRIDVAVLRINIETVVELDVRLGTRDDPFRLGKCGA